MSTPELTPSALPEVQLDDTVDFVPQMSPVLFAEVAIALREAGRPDALTGLDNPTETQVLGRCIELLGSDTTPQVVATLVSLGKKMPALNAHLWDLATDERYPRCDMILEALAVDNPGARRLLETRQMVASVGENPPIRTFDGKEFTM